MFLKNELEDILSKYKLYASQFALIKDGKIYANFTHSINNTIHNDSIFRVASISKLIVTIAILKLYDEDHLSLEEDISTYLGYSVRNPHFKHRHITIKMLLSHTSSFQEHPNYMVPFNENIEEMFAQTGKYYTDELFLKKDNKYVQPGSVFEYYNGGFMILATIIEKVSNQRFDDYIQRAVLEPLDITGAFNISHFTKDERSNIEPIVRYHEAYIHTIDFDLIIDNYDNYSIGQNGALFGPQGAFKTNATELIKLATFFIQGNEKVLSKHTHDLLFAPIINEGKYPKDLNYTYYRGYGSSIVEHKKNGNIYVGHLGNAYGMEGMFYVNKKEDYGFTYLTMGRDHNRSLYTLDNTLYLNFQQEVLELIDSKIHNL